MSVNDPRNFTKAEQLSGLKIQSDSIGLMVDLLNTYERYIAAERDSPMEDQEEKSVEDQVTAILNGSHPGEVIMAFLDALHNAARGANMQEYLHHVSEFLQAEVARIQGLDE